MNPRLVLEQKLFTMSFYTTYWKDEFFQRHLRVNVVRVYRVTSGNFSRQNLVLKNYLYIFTLFSYSRSTK